MLFPLMGEVVIVERMPVAVVLVERVLSVVELAEVKLAVLMVLGHEPDQELECAAHSKPTSSGD